MAKQQQLPLTDDVELSALEYHGLAIAAKPASKLRDRLELGGARVDITVRVHGDVLVAGDAESTVIKAVPADLLLAFVLSALGPKTRAAAYEAAIQECAEFVRGGNLPAPQPTHTALAEDLLRHCSRPVVQRRRGNVTGVVQVELVARAG